jgi:hypothetical protein
MFAIIPNEVNRPPRPWRDFYAEEGGGRFSKIIGEE